MKTIICFWNWPLLLVYSSYSLFTVRYHLKKRLSDAGIINFLSVTNFVQAKDNWHLSAINHSTGCFSREVEVQVVHHELHLTQTLNTVARWWVSQSPFVTTLKIHRKLGSSEFKTFALFYPVWHKEKQKLHKEKQKKGKQEQHVLELISTFNS